MIMLTGAPVAASRSEVRQEVSSSVSNPAASTGSSASEPVNELNQRRGREALELQPSDEEDSNASRSKRGRMNTKDIDQLEQIIQLSKDNQRRTEMETIATVAINNSNIVQSKLGAGGSKAANVAHALYKQSMSSTFTLQEAERRPVQTKLSSFVDSKKTEQQPSPPNSVASSSIAAHARCRDSMECQVPYA
jgi:hypothetical protein